jgi:hypothetical protein
MAFFFGDGGVEASGRQSSLIPFSIHGAIRLSPDRTMDRDKDNLCHQCHAERKL